MSRLWHSLAAIATLGSYALATPHGHLPRGHAHMHAKHLTERDDYIDSSFDQSDLSFIKRMAAVGDSYSAGIGAGDRLGNIGEALSSESVISQVLNDQIPNIDSNQQVIMLSAGGNDVELSNILNQCIYQWAVFNSAQVTLAKAAALADPRFKWGEGFDWDSLGLGCDGQLARTKKLIEGDAFSKNLDSVIAAAKKKLGKDGMIYYTGYAKFWAEDLSPACDKVSWSTWIYDSQTLTSAHRKTMNDLVDAVNAKISAAVKKAGSQVEFVDYDSYVGYYGGRFCEKGVDESTTDSNTRTGLMFYELNTWDPLGSNPRKRSYDAPMNGTFEGSVNQLAQITLLVDPNAKFSDKDSNSNAGTAAASLEVSKVATSAKVADVEVPNVLPDGYGRVFHPQILLHKIISGLVIYKMIDQNLETNGFTSLPEKISFDSCPYYSGSGGSGNSGGQQIGLASYINPLADPGAWDRMIDYPADKVSVLVANVLNGPDTSVNEDWKKVIKRAKDAGKTVLGYVRTGYLGVSQNQFTTRLGSTTLADWTSQIQSDVDLWYELYPDMIGGIFFDEGFNECGENNIYANLYRFISDTTKRKHPGAFTVLNPGATMPQCFEHSADTLMTFENSYDTYINSYVGNPDWTPEDPRKLWHIIYNVPSDSVAHVTSLALERGAGLIHITDDTLPNPYDTLPADDYMQTIMKAVDGGGPAVADPSSYSNTGSAASVPSGLKVTASDYSSVSLSWSGSGFPYAYAVYQDGKEVVRLLGSMTEVTIGNIKPGSSMSFTVRARSATGKETADSNSVKATTDELPNNQAITNAKVSSTATSTTIQADVLVPFAFLRVFLTDPDTNCQMPAWPINYNLGNYICTHHMVEGENFFQYSGAKLAKGETNYPWSWSPQGSAPVSRDGYTYTWKLPIGSSSVDPNYFVVEGQGYGPLTNIFHPCPSTWSDSTTATGAYCTGKGPYDCKGEPLCSTMNVKFCDKAVNQMQRGSKIYTANGEALAISGNCWANWEQFGCKVTVRGKDENGKNCQITGDEMWEAYQDIRKNGGCKKCGTKHFGNGCLVSVDYYYGCNNRDPGVNSIED
ncbi:fibronectin type III domain protein [Aspergillus steynii IBT 23096]|uniref:Fibronectin type III domain protein n=1 Tax=Aspergillus steynii IBT 23096 TaxID=1392250 RepID=A0A2I2G7F7_9EURO|nr:fibronectin type III domain protein [Aspergillus steynii IBT 23096]PLB48819.1 fibronectin type III domain protein [Aspergillus steynii IBT 23096]